MSADKTPRRFLILMILLCTVMVLAQQLISFRKVSVNDGLSQSSIGYLLQDSRGYLWISTSDGLNRYDGYEFEIFRNNPDDPYSLSSSRVGLIMEDPQHYLWVSTDLSVERFDQRTGRFMHFQHDPENDSTISPGEYTALCYDSGGAVWVGSQKGIEIIDTRTFAVRHIRFDSTQTNGLPSAWIKGIEWIDEGMLVGTDSGLCIITRDDYRITPFDAPIKRCRRVMRDNSGNIAVIGDSSLFMYDKVSHALRYVAGGKLQGPRGEFLPSELTAITSDKTGNLWLGGWQRLAPIRLTDGGFEHEIYFSNGVWPTGSAAICIDNGQNVWSGGEGSELFTGNISTSRFISYHLPAPGLSDQMVNSAWSCSEDTNGCFWVTSQMSVQKVDPRSGAITFYSLDPANPRSLPTNGGSFHGFCDSKGRMWIDCNLSLCLYNEKTDDFTLFPYKEGDTTSHPRSNGSIITETKDGKIWLGTYGKSMSHFDPSTGKYRTFYIPKGQNGAPSGYVVRSVFEDQDSTIWVGTNRGFDRFDPDQGKYYPMMSNSPYASEIFGIQQTEPGFLWLGSNVHGLLKFDIAKQEIVGQYLDNDGLANNTIYEIEADSAGTLWISTNHGISHFDPKTETFRNYDHSDGILHNEFSGAAGKFTTSGWMLFGCTNGIVAFRPDQMEENPYPPRVLITRMRIFNKEVGIHTEEVIPPDSSVFQITVTDSTYSLPIDISFIGELELDYDQNFLSFDFVALHFSAPEKNQYAYMMEGLEEKWNDCGTQRNASYTNIPPGEYTFRVKAANSDGVWNEEGKSIHIVIHPPWWETWWFRTLAIVAAISAVAGFFQYRTASLRKRQKELEQTVRERTAEVVAQKEEITIQKHMVEEKQKEIIDSINYAQRIQQALLAGDKLLQKNLGDHFVLFKPKDIVAGDFYWGTSTSTGFMLITADCTGHGVPGAFMSLLNISKLSETINEKQITRPDLVLNNVRSEIIRSLNPNPTDNSQDGMDCILCKFDFANRTLEYAAANNSFYIVRNNTLISCKADKMPVGKSHDDPKPFSLHTVQLQPGDTIYTLTDGYPDQFGGPKGKKFKYRQLEEMFVKIASLPTSKQKEMLANALNEWRGNLEQVDDICIIGIRIS